MKSIRTFILTTSAVVSVLFFGSSYIAVSRIFEDTVRADAQRSSDAFANTTFNAMFQLMSTGWQRKQVEGFIAAIKGGTRDSAFAIDIYRGEVVETRYGVIAQGNLDESIRRVFTRGEASREQRAESVRSIFPLKAEARCLTCHDNAHVGDVLGVIDVTQDLGPAIRKAKDEFIASLGWIAPIPLIMALLVVLYVNRRIDGAIESMDQRIEAVNRVADLHHLDLKDEDLGFAELNSVFHKVGDLAKRLRSVAVDKDLLEFEIRLLEKFVITSDVVKDWREYIIRLLIDINQIVDAYTLFSIFKVDDELFDLEVFWRSPPSDRTKALLEATVRRTMAEHPNFSEVNSVHVGHHVADPAGVTIDLDEHEIEVQVKSLLVETPKIGGIVGIGVQAEIVKDETRILVLDSVLSTLLNVVGSVKAIYKYTRDLEYYATRDPLTNLYNQRVFWEMLGYEVGRAERHNMPFGLLVVDLDNFKMVNDSYGHSFGDRFLEQFSKAMRRALRGGDILSRYGGDEFTAILSEADIQQACSVAERIVAESQTMTLEAPDGTPVKATVSVGVAMYPEHAKEPKDLFLFADNMMYKAKIEGKGRVGIPTNDDVVEVFRSIGEKSLIVINAVEEKRIIPHFQPILDVRRNEVHAIEVLSRIQLEGGRIMGAGEFVEIAERAGIIHKLDYLVIEKAFEAINEQGFGGKIFLNLSPRALVLAEFIPEVRRIIAGSAIDPTRVVFEITERDTVKNMALLERFINELKLEGFNIAIDDFGSGFSSFHYLKRFPVDYLKIEGDFIANMLNDSKDRAFVHSMAGLAQELGIHTVAEYVESQEVLDQVAECGIDFAQGYHIGHPKATGIGQIEWPPKSL